MRKSNYNKVIKNTKIKESNKRVNKYKHNENIH